MRPTRLVAILGLTALAIATASAAPQQIQRSDRVLRSGVDVVAVTATVLDAEGRLALDLPREAFEIFEDGEPQTITQFTNERVPVGLGVLLDTSDSMFGQRIQDARAAVERFLFELLDPSDEFFVMAFNHQPHVLTRWTSAPDVVRRGARRRCGRPAARPSTTRSSRRCRCIDQRPRERAALLVISDGADTASDATVCATCARRCCAATRSSTRSRIDSPDRQAINTRVNAGGAAARSPTESGGRTEVVQDMAELDDGDRRASPRS